MSAGQPKHSIRSELCAMCYVARNEPEECLVGSTMAGRSRALFVTKRHKTPQFAYFFWPFPRLGGPTKSSTRSPAYVSETKPHRFVSLTQVPVFSG